MPGCPQDLFFHQVDVSSYPLFKYPPYTLALATKLADVASSAGLDVIHAHYAVPHATSAYLAKQMRAPCDVATVTTLHGTDITLVGVKPSFYEITRFSIEQSDRVTAVSDWLRQKTIESFSYEKPIEVVHELFSFSEPATSAESLFGISDKPVFESIADDSNLTPESEYAGWAANELLAQWLDLLPKQQRLVVEHRFGLHGKGRLTLEEVGQLLGVTRERVRQVQLAALTRLREISRREGVTETPFME